MITGSPRDGVVEVRWFSTGQAMQYRWGIENAYDLFLVSDPKPKPPGAASTGSSGGGISTGGGGISFGGGAGGGAGALDTLWTCLVQLHKSIIPEALGQVNLSKPDNIAGFYNALWKYECAIKPGAQTPEWKDFRRAQWEREMKSPRCDAEHAAVCLSFSFISANAHN